jgi:GNAT superfamily N-acetyltransferase
LFAEQPKVFGLMCEQNGLAIGFAIYFYNYSTWLGKHGIYLEDLYVTPESRGLGAGKALLKRLAEIAVDNNCGRVEWSVLDWNEPAIRFYESIGAGPQDEWTVYRLTGEALQGFAKSS